MNQPGPSRYSAQAYFKVSEFSTHPGCALKANMLALCMSMQTVTDTHSTALRGLGLTVIALFLAGLISQLGPIIYYLLLPALCHFQCYHLYDWHLLSCRAGAVTSHPPAIGPRLVFASPNGVPDFSPQPENLGTIFLSPLA